MDHAQLIAALIDAAHEAIDGRRLELDALDGAIGDGDHGTNLARGLGAVAARSDELAAMPLPAALKEAAQLVGAETGGDGGRCYAALLDGMAGAATEAHADLPALARMVAAGVARLRGDAGAAPGGKTMVDVLQPVAEVLERQLAQGDTLRLGDRVLAAAAHGLHRTSRLEARHGRAAELGAASINHLDPGAWSATLLVGAVVSLLERAAASP